MSDDIVLIPLESGLAWSAGGYLVSQFKRLNPFEIRAGLEPTEKAKTTHAYFS